MSARAIAVSMGLLLALPCLGAAQGLGDAATRERQKRAKAAGGKEEPVRVITNEDLDRGRPPGGSEAAASSPSAAAVTEDVPPSTVVDRTSEVRPFVDAVASEQARIQSLEARIRELGGRLNPMSTTFIYGATGSNSPAEEAQVRESLTQSEAELAEARQALAAANRSLEDARRGRPPSSSAH